jgi:hypothetical protein
MVDCSPEGTVRERIEMSKVYRIVEDNTEWESRPQSFDNDEHARSECESMGWTVTEITADGVIHVEEYAKG